MNYKHTKALFNFIKSNIVSKKFLVTILLSTHVQAETIPCPSIDIIQNAAPKLNIVAKFNHNYTVYTEDYVYEKDKIYWRVGANHIIASSDENALILGKKMVKQTRFKNSDNAVAMNPVEYKCTYSPQHTYALGFKLSKRI